MLESKNGVESLSWKRVIRLTCFKRSKAAIFVLPMLAMLTSPATHLRADILEDCLALSSINDEIHNCLDNFLDLMDDNIADLEAFITAELSGAGPDNNAALLAFQSAQSAFTNYRRENCLWYLAFSSPRSTAEQIAKNCLATMSQQRLSELQSLISSQNNTGSAISGYYVYGADRNSFQACGDANRYWIEGENAVVSQLQQDYLSKSTAELQILYVSLTGSIDTEAGSPYPNHDGIFKLQSISSVRIPTDNDCQLPTKSDAANTKSLIDAAPTPEPAPVQEPAVAEPQAEVLTQLEPEQQLIAYFGEWVANCEQLGSSYGCRLSAPLVNADTQPGAPNAVLKLTRRSEQRTVIDVEFPPGLTQPEVDDISDITWRVDSVSIGKIFHSRLDKIRPSTDAGQSSSGQASEVIRQAIRERWFIRDELLPLLIDGRKVFITLTPSRGSQVVVSATLKGLTRALTFADDFTSAQGNK